MKTSEKEELKSYSHPPEKLQTVLVVDDDPMTVNAIKLTLEGIGYQVYTAENGTDALNLLKETPIAVIICDQTLPDFTGLEVLKQTIDLQPDTIRIVITGTADLKVAADLINIAQISHFILKPWDTNILTQAVKSSVEKFNLIQENQYLNTLTAKQTETLKKNHENLKNELTIGGRIQNLLLEGKVPQDIPDVQITGMTIPSREVDGDFFDFYQSSPYILDFVIGDVMGKGLPAALIGTAMKFQLARFAEPPIFPIIHQRKKGWHLDLMPLKNIIHEVNKAILGPLIQLEYFVSLLYGRFNFKNQTFTYIDCGSTKPLHYQKKNNQVSAIRGENYPLGLGEPGEIYVEKTIKFKCGDLIVFYSDGITEAQSSNGELFGTQRLASLIEKHHELPPSELMELIKQEVSQFSQKGIFEDDLTLIVFKMLKPTPNHSLFGQDIAKFSSHLSQLKAVRKFVSEFVYNIINRENRITDFLQLAVDEIFCNIVVHGYEEKKHGEIIIQVDYENDTFIIEILDQGKPFNPTAIEHPNLAGEEEGGFGFYIVKEIADTISYQRKKSSNGWNCLRITKTINLERLDMELSHYKNNDVIVIKIEGENLDAHESAEFKKKVHDLIENEKVNKIVLDLESLNFVDSTGLGSFLSIMRTLNSEKGEMKLANMSHSIYTIFELVCMHKIFEVYESVDEALAAFQKMENSSKD